MRKVSAKNKGFTLLELVISLALIAILIIPISNLVLGSVKINKAGEDKQQAGLKLQEVIENIKSVDLPKNVDEKIEVGNGVYVIKNEDETFSISDSNDKDIKIEGTIEEVEVGEAEKRIGSKKVDGAIYYDGASKKIGIGSFAKEEKQIKDAIESKSDEFKNIEDSVLKIIMKNDKITVICDKGSISEDIPCNYNALLICLDNYHDKNKLNISIENEDAEKKFTVYLYGKEGASKDDLILKEFKGNINMISTMGEKSLQTIQKYNVEIKAMKKGKQLETTNFTMIK